MHREIVTDAAKAAPPIAATSLELWGVSLSDWLILLTILYTVLLICQMLRKFMLSRRLSDRDPYCAEDCPVARRLIDNSERSGISGK